MERSKATVNALTTYVVGECAGSYVEDEGGRMDHELFLVFLHALENWKPTLRQDLLSILVPENSLIPFILLHNQY